METNQKTKGKDLKEVGNLATETTTTETNDKGEYRVFYDVLSINDLKQRIKDIRKDKTTHLTALGKELLSSGDAVGVYRYEVLTHHKNQLVSHDEAERIRERQQVMDRIRGGEDE